MQIDNSLIDMLNTSCERYSSYKAFSCLGASITFGELDRLSQQFASYLQYHTSLCPGDRLAIQLPNLLQYPVVLFGAIRAGAVIVNTNPLYTSRELKHQLKDSGAKVLVVLANFADTVESVIEETDVQQVVVTEIADLHPFPKKQIINGIVKYIKKQVPSYTFSSSVNLCRALELGKRDEFTRVELKPDDIAFIQYTGGTTGVAKGAVLTHKNLLSNKEQCLHAWPEDLKSAGGIFVAPLPLYHIYSFTIHCTTCFSIGAHSVLVPNPRDIESLVKVFESYSVKGMIGLNTLFIALLNHQKFKALDFSDLRITIAGGMALAQDTADRWQQLTGIKVLEGYGLTETSPVVSSNVVDNCQMGTIGRPLVETECRVIDDDGNVLSNGEAGELCVRGPQVMQGYWQRPEETALVFDDEGWFKTGDVAVIQDDGFIKIVDRKKDMIVVSGFNVYPNEVENILLMHPQIIEAAVVSIPDKNSGEAVKAFLVLAEGCDLDDENIKNFCRESLTAYKVPRFYEFRDSLPKTNVGKVLRRELRPS